MKLHFESDLPYQIDAIEAVCDLFRGQEVCRSVFTVTAQALGGEAAQQSFEGKQFTESGGIGNALQLIVDEELNENLQQVQLRNGLPPSLPLESKQPLDFTVNQILQGLLAFGLGVKKFFFLFQEAGVGSRDAQDAIGIGAI